jgi:hypothetical protein
MFRAPLATLLPSFLPVLLERGVPGYESAELTSGEKRLARAEIRSLLLAASYLGALDYAGGQLEMTRVEESLNRSLQELPELSPAEKDASRELIAEFINYRIIRENHPLDDWICEAWWSRFQSIDYQYPSAMSEAVAYGLAIRQSLRECSIEY